MMRKRPCRECGKWFRPDPRPGDRQHTCSSRKCQRERHRRACEEWRKKNPEYDREERVRKKVVKEVVPPGAGVDPMLGIAWDAARDEIGLEAGVVIEETGKVLVSWVRDEIARQVRAGKGKSGQVVGVCARDEMAEGTRPP
jgi:hypothetical protein